MGGFPSGLMMTQSPGPCPGEMKMKKLPLAAVAAVIAITSADAATFTRKNAPDGGTYVFVSGELKKGDGEKFSAYVKDLFGTPVGIVLNSPGGMLGDGILIGAIVNDQKWNTSVPSENVCASACTFIWLAGGRRFAGQSAHIGFHGVYDEKTKRPIAAGNAVAGAYLRDLGLSYTAIAWMMAKPADKTDWLTSAKAKELGIEAETL
jgi:hypothetical protein